MSRDRRTASPVQRTTGRILRISARHTAVGTGAIEFSAVEEEFFRAGDLLSQSTPGDFADLDAGLPPATFWRAMLGWLRNERTHTPE